MAWIGDEWRGDRDYGPIQERSLPRDHHTQEPFVAGLKLVRSSGPAVVAPIAKGERFVSKDAQDPRRRRSSMRGRLVARDSFGRASPGAAAPAARPAAERTPARFGPDAALGNADPGTGHAGGHDHTSSAGGDTEPRHDRAAGGRGARRGFRWHNRRVEAAGATDQADLPARRQDLAAT
jgi:hypothetical protein